MVLPWAVRRVRPVASAAVVTAAAVLHLLAGPEFSLSLLMVPLTVYNLAANAPGASPWPGSSWGWSAAWPTG